MSGASTRWPAAVALAASLLGLTFAILSSVDYTKHLDRQIHDVHCSFVPGLGAEATAENACRVAMYSPFAALFRDRYWGGVPISLFAVGAFGFFAAFALYLLVGGRHTPRRASQFLAVFGFAPLMASALMAAISALKLGHFCKTCVGIYASSLLLATTGIALWTTVRGEGSRPWRTGNVSPTVADADRTALDPEPLFRPDGPLWLVALWALALGVFAS